MTTYILLSICLSLTTTGIYAATWPGMILYSVKKKLADVILSIIVHGFKLKVRKALRVETTICKPVFGCLICMSSVWTLVYWLISGCWFNPFYTIPMVAGINAIISSLIYNISPDEK